MFKCYYKLDSKVQNELNKSLWVLALICTICGAIGFAIYVVLVAIGAGAVLQDYLFLYVFFLAFGILLLFMVKRINTISIKRNLSEELELNEDYLVEKISQNNEVVATNKHYYKSFTKIKEAKNFLFLYINSAGAVAIPKSLFTPEDFTKIKNLINTARYKK